MPREDPQGGGFTGRGCCDSARAQEQGRGRGAPQVLGCELAGGPMGEAPQGRAGSQVQKTSTPTGPQLTVRAGAAFPAIPADAGEGVATAHAGAPIHAGVGQAAAVFGYRREEGLLTHLARPAQKAKGMGQGWHKAPHQWCRCCPSSQGGRHSGKCPHYRSRFRHYCRCRHHTGTHLQAHGAQQAAQILLVLVECAPPLCLHRGPMTHESGRSCPSSRHRTHSRSH